MAEVRISQEELDKMLEIDFEAGARSRDAEVEELKAKVQALHDSLQKAIVDCQEIGMKKGRREVVEWSENHYHYQKTNKDWQEQKKLWKLVDK